MRHGHWLSQALSLEAVDGRLHKEVEHVFYGKLDHPEELKNAQSALHQEQWMIKVPKTDDNAGSGTMRVRCEHGYGESPRYIFTTKAKSADGHNVEHEVPTTSDHMELMKVLADKGMVKTRYTFPIAGSQLVWEVDVFTDEEGLAAPYVKLDLEVPVGVILDQVPPVPVTLSDVVTGEEIKLDPVADAKVARWHDEHFLRRNVHHVRNEKATSELSTLQSDIDREAALPDHVFKEVVDTDDQPKE
jgi:CYTH domain-containing protein